MEAEQIPRHLYGDGQVCVFTNRSGSDDTSNNGKRCKIVRHMSIEEWRGDKPEYIILFLNERKIGIRARENELESTTEEGDAQ